MHIEIASIGDELLLGVTVNANAAWISRELAQRGLFVKRHSVLPDDKRAIRKGIEEALARAELVIATGGLGPTIDDLTRDSLEGLFSEKPTALKNSVGSAPGAFYFSNGKGVVLLPGPPREMERMFADQALPAIEKFFPLKKQSIHAFSLCLFKESEIDPYLADLKRSHPEIECGLYPARGTLQIVLRSEKSLDALGREFEAKFPTFVFPDRTIEEAVHRELTRRKKTLGLAESCTGGAIAARLSAVPGASLFLLGSIVAYSNGWKERFLKVDPKTLEAKGAVSPEIVGEMIEGIFSETEADYAIAVSGIAGPSGGTREKPVGTIYIGVGKRGERSDIGKIYEPRDRAIAIDLSVQTALCALWRRIVHNTPTFS